MVWGTLILFADCIMMILLYERLRRVFGRHLLPRIALTGALILTFDQGAFFCGLHYLTGAPLSVLFGGWAAKMAAVAIYAGLGAVYLRFVELPRRTDKRPPRLGDVFDLLTYRERYEDLMASSGRDALTGALDRGRLEREGRHRVAAAALSGRPLTLLILDIDHFKSFNDRFGHTAGDVVLLRIARIVMRTVGVEDAVFRFGGEEFVVIVPDMSRAAALTLGERIRRDVASHMDAAAGTPLVTVSIGLATCAEDASDYDGLFECADRRLYLAEIGGKKSRHRPQRRKRGGFARRTGDAGVAPRSRRVFLSPFSQVLPFQSRRSSSRPALAGREDHPKRAARRMVGGAPPPPCFATATLRVAFLKWTAAKGRRCPLPRSVSLRGGG